MRRGWLVAAVIGGMAGVSNAADVQIFGINTTNNHWAVYARISNPDSIVAGEQVSGLSSISVNLVNNGATGPSVLTSVNNLPMGTTPYTDNIFTPPNVGYGFWLVRSNGTVGPEPVPSGSPATGRSGAFNISGGQYTFPDTIDPNTSAVLVPYTQLVVSGAGLSAGKQVVDSKHTSATAWDVPVQIASGTYQPGSDPAQGLKIEYSTDTVVNLIRDTDPTAGISWAREGAVSFTVIDARNFTIGQANAGQTTVRAGMGDVDLDGQVGFADLVKVAQNYGQSGRTWLSGDFDFDGNVGFSDLVTVAQNYGGAAPASPVFSGAFEQDMARAFASVPEPGTVGLLGVLAAGGLLKRQKRK